MRRLAASARHARFSPQRRQLLRAAAVATALDFVASPAPALARGRIELEFPSWQAEEPGLAQFWRSAADAFQAANPDVWINFYQVSFKDFTDKMTLRFASDNPPHIVQLPTRNVQQFASQGWLAPLDPLLATTDIPSTYLQLGDDLRWRGHTIGVPLMQYGMILYYNQRLLDAAGRAVPANEAQLLDAIAATTDAGRGIYGWAATTMQHPNIYTDWAAWATGEGASFYRDGHYAFSDPQVVQAIDHLRVALRHAPRGLSTESARQLFIDGKIAMFRDGPWIAPLLDRAPAGVRPDLKLGMMPFRYVPGGISNSIHLPDRIDPVRRARAWDFIRMLSTPAWQARFALETGSPAPRRHVLTPMQLDAHPALRIAVASLDGARSISPSSPAAQARLNQISQLVAEAGMRLINSDAPTASLLADLQDELQQRVPLS